MPKYKTLAIAFLKKARVLARKIYDEENCTVEEAVHKAWSILLPKYLKIIDEKK